MFFRAVVLGLVVSLGFQSGQAEDQPAKDARIGKVRTLNDSYHPWTPADTKTEWEAQRQRIRERILVSNGLWPMPPKLPLRPVIHGAVDRGEYTVHRVYFQSLPGHYVTGSLFKPKNIKGKVPGVLCPHGHWANGRFYDAGANKAKEQLGKNAEQHESGARYPVQARMAQLARMGCVVFHYDMVGYADSKPIDHRQGFTDVEAALRLQNAMGLQTFNSIRALDFLMSLPEVDPDRIGVTGASGGGTQTFILCAIDDRPDVAFPAVMVGTAMQGGCVCENAAYLRIGLNNVAFAAAFAPKPMALSGANDWTVDIESKGLPELKQVYNLYGEGDKVHAKCYPQFGHNYNQVSREMMYHWFNQHLDLKQKTPIREQPFEPLSNNELTVYLGETKLPGDAADAQALRRYLTSVAEEQFAWGYVKNQPLGSLRPTEKAVIRRYRHVVGTAARIMLDEGVPSKEEVTSDIRKTLLENLAVQHKGTIGRKGTGEQIPFVAWVPKNFNGKAVLWVDGKGKSRCMNEDGSPNKDVQAILKTGKAVVSVDVYLTGEMVPDANVNLPEVNSTFQGYTFCYNRPTISNRVRDILTAVAATQSIKRVQEVHLLGTKEAGPWVLLAGGLAQPHIASVRADANNFSFSKITSVNDQNFLPGALKYGDLGGLAALNYPNPLYITNGKFEENTITRLYRHIGLQDRVHLIHNGREQALIHSLIR